MGLKYADETVNLLSNGHFSLATGMEVSRSYNFLSVSINLIELVEKHNILVAIWPSHATKPNVSKRSLYIAHIISTVTSALAGHRI